MLNKTKNNEGIRRNPSAVANRRPKRCHLCKKTFAFDKYDQHFQNCYRFQNKKIEESKAKSTYKPAPPKHQSSMANTKYKKAESTKKQTVMNPQHLQTTANKFRIKNTSHVSQKFKNRNNEIKPQPTNTKSKISKNEVQIKRQKEVQRPVNPEKKQEIRDSIVSSHAINIQSSQSVNPSFLNSNIQENNRRQEESESLSGFQQSRERQTFEIQRPSQPQVRQISPPVRDQIPVPVRQVSPPPRQQIAPPARQQIPPVRQQIQPPRPRPEVNNQRSVMTSNRQIMFTGDDSEQGPAQQPYDIQAVINNSNSIIEFIRGMNFMREDETLSIMVAQLLQLNQIAEQIAQLNLMGRSLAFRMGNVFSARIHQLQTAIINQIGIALIRGFNDRLGEQFLNLTRIQPDLKVGFTQEQIENLFPQKFNLSQKQCSICLQDMKRSQLVMQLQCKHIFHPTCIKQWLISSKKCPMCRSLQKAT